MSGSSYSTTLNTVTSTTTPNQTFRISIPIVYDVKPVEVVKSKGKLVLRYHANMMQEGLGYPVKYKKRHFILIKKGKRIDIYEMLPKPKTRDM